MLTLETRQQPDDGVIQGLTRGYYRRSHRTTLEERLGDVRRSVELEAYATATLAGVEERLVEVLLACPALARREEDVRRLSREAVRMPWLIDARYTVHRIPKKSGGHRVIEAPDELLKTAQAWVLRRVLYRNNLPSSRAYGFVPGKGVRNNAAVHCRRRPDNRSLWLWKADLADFFPSISAGKALTGLVETLSRAVDDALLEPRGARAWGLGAAHWGDIITYLGVVYLCTYKERLPQGAPTSPFLSNLVYRRMDTKMLAIIRNTGSDAIYTRYADDICISGEDMADVRRLGRIAQNVVERGMGGVVNLRKTALCRHGRPMRVTGVNINQGPSISRYKRDKVRAWLHNAVKRGSVSAKDRMRLGGYKAFYAHVDREGWERRCGGLYREMLKLPTLKEAAQ